MVQLSTPWGDPEPGNGAPVRRFLSNYFDLLLNVDGIDGLCNSDLEINYIKLFQCCSQYLMR